MSKKQDAFYFDNFVACADYSVKAARLLKEILSEVGEELQVHLYGEVEAMLWLQAG